MYGVQQAASAVAYSVWPPPMTKYLSGHAWVNLWAQLSAVFNEYETSSEQDLPAVYLVAESLLWFKPFCHQPLLSLMQNSAIKAMSSYSVVMLDQTQPRHNILPMMLLHQCYWRMQPESTTVAKSCGAKYRSWRFVFLSLSSPQPPLRFWYWVIKTYEVRSFFNICAHISKDHGYSTTRRKNPLKWERQLFSIIRGGI